jgi:hypothetical protein
MLIVCSGPDTWHARHKAQELMQAFKAKHDPTGYSTMVLTEPDVQQLVQQLGAPSLFAAKRFIRCDGILTKLKIADVRMLAKRLQADQDQTIVVTIEEEAPAQKTLDELKESPLFHYPHPLLQGSGFRAWCEKYAAELGVSLERAREIAQRFEGDIWFAEQELKKSAVNPLAPLAERADVAGSLFDVAERHMKDATWRLGAKRLDDDGFLPVLVTQYRSLLRVRDGATQGLHPYVAKKLAYIKSPTASKKFLRVLRAFVANRTGLSSADEVETLF